MKTIPKTVSIIAGLSGLLLVLLLVSGCGGEKKVLPIPVGEMDQYRDPVLGFQIKFPKGWVQSGEAGRAARFYNAQEVDKRFLDPTGPYPDGVLIAIDITRTATPDAEKKRMVTEMSSVGMVVGKEEAITVGGAKGMKVPYTAKYSTKVQVTGHHVYVLVDSMLYDFGFAGFGVLYEAHKAVFDASLSSFQFPKPVEKGKDLTLPAENTSENDAKLFTFQYPDNFNFESTPKGNNELALSLRGAHKSSSIQFTVFGAKGLTLEKVFDQNKGKFAGAVAGKATVGGQPALTLTYSPTKDVERRFYFVVRNDKVYRIAMDWVKPQRDQYLAAYDKVVNSIKFK